MSSLNLETLTYGDHLCFIYQSREEQMSVIIPFILEGFKRNEKCLYIVDENSEEDILREIKKHCDVENYITSGQLVILRKEETYLKDGFFDPDRMIQLVKTAEREAMEEGYSGLRGTGEMTWVKDSEAERLLEYEAKLNHFFPKNRCIAICQYNEKKFDPGVLIGIIHTHPKLILYDTVLENPYYIPPDVFLTKMRSTSKELYRILKKLILDRAKVEEARIEDRVKKENYLYSIIKSIPSAIFIVDTNRKITLWNSAAEKITGLRGEEVIGRRCDEVLESPDCKECGLFDEVPKPFTTRCEIRTNGKKWILKTVDFLRDEEGKIIGGIEAFQDITERVEMEEELRRSGAKYRDLFENSLDVIVVTNLRGEFIDVNKAFEEVLGYSRDEIIGESFRKIVGSKENADFIFKKYNEAFKQGKDLYGLETEIITKKGKRLFVEGNIRLIRENGKIVAFQGNFRDITDRKKLEKSLSELNDILRLLNKILRHDIINDLSAIRAAIEFFLETGDGKYLEKVLDRIDRSVSLIKQMRELEELARFKELKAMKVSDLIGEIGRKYAEAIDEINIEGDGVVEANEALASVFDNLISNSIRHGNASRVDVTIEEKGDFCEIRIADNGKGIPDEIKDLIFDEGFSYGDAKGSGLGLYISKRIIEAYNGTINVEDSESGAVFIIRLKSVKKDF
jgi:PAS domain S-box-containing protein